MVVSLNRDFLHSFDTPPRIRQAALGCYGRQYESLPNLRPPGKFDPRGLEKLPLVTSILPVNRPRKFDVAIAFSTNG